MENATLRDMVRYIENHSGYMFVFSEKLDMEQRKSIDITGKPVSESLKHIFGRTGISWRIQDNHIILDKAGKITVSGYVTDHGSMETLIGASVRDTGSGAGSFTNSYGYYSIQADADSVSLQVSYLGYKPVVKKIFAQKDTVINFRLHESNTVLANVTVYNTKAFDPSGGSVVLEGSAIKPTPASFGENDIMKSLQSIPGVKAGIEGAASIMVRGGSPDQNLILIDGSPLYNTGHYMGLFSVFNGDAVKKVSLHKGSFPARYGGRLSSVVDVRFKDGDMQQYHADVTMGIAAAHLNAEGPIIKGKTSFSFSARRSYIDAFLRLIQKINDDNRIETLYLYDINAKINHKFSDRSRLYLSYYSGRDKMNREEKPIKIYEAYNDLKDQHSWGTDIWSLRWNYVWSNRLFMNASAAYNQYKFNYDSKTNERYEGNEENYIKFQKSGIKDWQFGTDFEYQPDNNHYVRFGGQLALHNFSPEIHGYHTLKTSDSKEEWTLNYYLYDNVKGSEMSLYAEDEFSITNKLKTNMGLHFSVFNVQNKNYISLQPRLSFGYELNPKTALKVSYTKMNQYVNLLTSNVLNQPNDLWVPITKNLKPMSAHQFTAGVFYDTKSGYKFSAEGFYKRMYNILEYNDRSSWKDLSTSWEEYVEPGKGRTYGIELTAQKETGRFTGWAGYTLSWNDRRFPTINEGRRFWAKYDNRHYFNITGTFKASNKIHFSASWMYATGNRTTIPLDEYQSIEEIYNIYYNIDYVNIKDISNRNNYKLSDMHHLDIEMKYYRSPKKIWTFGIYNVYNRLNPYTATLGYHVTDRPVIIEKSMMGIIPSVSFTYKFK